MVGKAKVIYYADIQKVQKCAMRKRVAGTGRGHKRKNSTPARQKAT
jgi:hypothetical protein